jgi:hypothetical protein
MKLKILVIIIASFLLSGGLRAQGIYSNNKTTDTNTENNDAGIVQRAAPGQGSGDGKDDGAPGKDSDPNPIGEGILILSLLSGGYALVKRNVRNKHEN